MLDKTLKVVISAGELSGDEHAASLITSLKKFYPNLEVKGMGGRNMRLAGGKTLVNSEESASVMGFDDLLGSLGKVLSALKDMKALLRNWRPNLLIIIDYPDFNLRLAKVAKSLNIPVLYYISPQVWAWRSSRVKLIEKVIDKVATIFPFERRFFESKGYKRAVYVGHPFADSLRNAPFNLVQRQRFLSHLGLDFESPVVALFPGSRHAEIKRHLKPMLESVRKLREQYPNIQAIVASPVSLEMKEIKEAVKPYTYIKVVRGNSLQVLRSANVGLLKSGTSNLQAAFEGLPFAMFYKASKFTEFIVTRFVAIREYSIVNIIKSKSVKELIQEKANAKVAAQELENLLLDPDYRAQVKQNLAEVVDQLSAHDENPVFFGCANASERVARLALGMMGVEELSASKAKALQVVGATTDQKISSTEEHAQQLASNF